MIHITEELRKEHPWLAAASPEIYSVSTVEEFYRNKDIIIPTKAILPPGVFFREIAIISMPTARYERETRYSGKLSDLTGELSIDTLNRSFTILPLFKRKHMEPRHWDNLKDRMMMYNICLTYHIHEDNLYLISYKTKGPAIPEENSLEKITSCPA